MVAFNKRQARRYLVAHGLTYKLSGSVWKQLLGTGRLFPDVGHRYSKSLLDLYITEVKPR